MAESNKNTLYLYVGAAVLSVVVIGLPFFLGSSAETQGVAEEATIALQELVDDPPLPTRSVLDSRNEVEQQWEVGAAQASDPGWVTEIAPAYVRVYSREPPKEPIHGEPALTQLACDRDTEAKKCYIDITGKVEGGKAEHIQITEVQLYRKADDGGFTKIDDATGAPGPGGTFTYRDTGVEAGKSYTYKLVSIAEKHPEAPRNVKDLAVADRRKESAEFGPTEPVPFDFSLRLIGIQSDQATGEPFFFARLTYWDYEAGKLQEDRSSRKFKEKDKFGGGRYDFFPVDADARTVTVRDRVHRKQQKVSLKDKGRSVTCWPPYTGAAPAAEEPAAEAAAPDAGADAEKKTTKKKKRTSPKKATGGGKKATDEKKKTKRGRRRSQIEDDDL